MSSCCCLLLPLVWFGLLNITASKSTTQALLFSIVEETCVQLIPKSHTQQYRWSVYICVWPSSCNLYNVRMESIILYYTKEPHETNNNQTHHVLFRKRECHILNTSHGYHIVHHFKPHNTSSPTNNQTPYDFECYACENMIDSDKQFGQESRKGINYKHPFLVGFDFVKKVRQIFTRYTAWIVGMSCRVIV